MLKKRKEKKLIKYIQEITFETASNWDGVEYYEQAIDWLHEMVVEYADTLSINKKRAEELFEKFQY